MIIKGKLILEKNMEYDEDLDVYGSITGKDGIRYSLKVKGKLSARNIYASNIEARDIYAWNIDAWDIKTWNIDAWDIDAENIKLFYSSNPHTLDGWIDAMDVFALNIDCKGIDARELNVVSIKALLTIKSASLVYHNKEQSKEGKLISNIVIQR
jgi:hypothetical protein